MDDETKPIPVIFLDETAYRRIGYLPPPLQPYLLRHSRVAADRPPERLLSAASALEVSPCPGINLDTLTEILAGAQSVILVACSEWRSPHHLMHTVKTLHRNGSDFHLLLADSLMDTHFHEECLPKLMRRVATVVRISPGAAKDDRLSGCLESMACALRCDAGENFLGLLEWSGSHQSLEINECLEEVMSSIDPGHFPFLVTARLDLENKIRLDQVLHHHGLGECPLAVAARPKGARVGVFFRIK